ncbi:MAG: glycosyl transferase family protein [Pseudomonadota bacterium]
MSLAPYIHAMGRGPSRSRSLTRQEATDAMAQILAGNAAPEAVGALLMLMRFRGETPAELAGFTQSARDTLTGWTDLPVALDWPSYAAGRSRGLPWFVLSALLVVRAGHRVLLHGCNARQTPVSDVRDAARALGIPFVACPVSAGDALTRQGIAYAPLDAISPELLGLLRLRDVLGLRSAINTVCRMLNPAAAPAMVQGVFHPAYRELQRDAAELLGQCRMMVIKGGGGEFERHPGKACALYGLEEADPFNETAPPLIDAHRRLADGAASRDHLIRLWQGESADPWAEAVVTGTAALALRAADPRLDANAAERSALDLWKTRHRQAAA